MYLFIAGNSIIGYFLFIVFPSRVVVWSTFLKLVEVEGLLVIYSGCYLKLATLYKCRAFWVRRVYGKLWRVLIYQNSIYYYYHLVCCGVDLEGLADKHIIKIIKIEWCYSGWMLLRKLFIKSNILVDWFSHYAVFRGRLK